MIYNNIIIEKKKIYHIVKKQMTITKRIRLYDIVRRIILMIREQKKRFTNYE